MKVIYSWLNDFINIEDKKPAEVASVLESLGHEVEAIVERDRETVYELAVTPNRGDTLSHLGVARELAARSGETLRKPVIEPELKLEEQPQVIIQDTAACPVYTARYLAGLNHNELPAEIRQRLILTDHSQIDPIVDLTNYVMEELGIPIHAFDADKVVGLILIRRAEAGETIELLNGEKRSLTNQMLVIADQEGPLALAGIMGGTRAAVTNETNKIILEAAYFAPAGIRRTRQALKLASDASYRFERGTDPDAARLASDRVADLMCHYLGAEIGPRLDAGSMSELPQRSVIWDSERINQLLGTNLAHEQMLHLLASLGLIIEDNTWLIPTWRHDLAIPEDLAEEVARLVGYDQLPRADLPGRELELTNDHEIYLQTEALKDRLVSQGWTEHIGSSFLSKTEQELLGADDAMQLENPVSAEAAYLRPSLLISLVRAMSKNPVFPTLALFEIGTVFERETESQQLGLAVTGKAALNRFEALKLTNFQSVPQALLDHFKIRRPVWFWQGSPADLVSELSPSTSETFTLSDEPVIARLPSRYQPVLRDIALIVDQNVDSESIAGRIRKMEWVTDVELFDKYTGPTLGPNNQSLAFHILLEHPNRTLTNTEIEETIDSVSELLKKEFNASIR